MFTEESRIYIKKWKWEKKLARACQSAIYQFVPKAVDFPMTLDPEIPLLESSLKEIIINVNKDLDSKMSTIDS